jgi:hypothetical protein
MDLFVAGHVHIYQRFYPLRMHPYGPKVRGEGCGLSQSNITSRFSNVSTEAFESL